MVKNAQMRKNEARERARIRREQERRKAQQRKIITYTGVIVGVIAVIAAIVVVGVLNKSSNKNDRVAASPAIVSAIANVPPANLDTVGLGTVQAGLYTISNQPPLTADGKPEVLYVGGEFCPFCAAERWAMAIALSRFGQFTDGLETTRSAVDDGNIPTLTFLNAKYTSTYITFVPVEAEDRNRKELQKLTDDQRKLTAAILPGGLSFPFLDFGNKYLLNGGSYSPTFLNKYSAEEIAQQMSNPTSEVGKAIMGSANVMTAAICNLTNNQPGNVCSSAAVKAGSTLVGTRGDTSTIK